MIINKDDNSDNSNNRKGDEKKESFTPARQKRTNLSMEGKNFFQRRHSKQSKDN